MLITTTPKYEAADATAQKVFANAGGQNILYGKAPADVESGGTPTGTLEPGQSVSATNGYWFRCASGSSELTVRALSVREELEGDISEGGGSSGIVEFTDVEGDYTLKASDAGKIVRVPRAGLDEEEEEIVTVITIPDEETVAIPQGATIRVVISGGDEEDGGVRVALAEGPSLHGLGNEGTFGSLSLVEGGQQGAACVLVKVNTDQWAVESQPGFIGEE